MLVDTLVYALAEHFLKPHKSATAEDTQELAESIQGTIDDFCSALTKVEEEG